MKTKILKFSAMVLVLYAGGCATVASRSRDGITITDIYPASAMDLLVIWDSGLKGNPPIGPRNEQGGTSLPFFTRTFIIVGGILDIPFSILTDTLYLPFDFYNLLVVGDGCENIN